MSIILFFTEAFFLLWITRNVLFWLSLWQIKEYRFDRMFVHVTGTEHGKRLFLSPLLFIKLLVIAGFLVAIYNSTQILPYEIIIGIIFILSGMSVVEEIKNHALKRPIFTIKASIIFLLSMSIVFLFFYFPLLEESVWLLVVDRLAPFFIGFFVLLFLFPTEMYRDFQIGRATEKMTQHKKMLVIGITGSYGKSSTKEYVAQILKKKFRVVKTKGTNNTPIGVANTILSAVQSNTEIFVVEMGAYKKGEIAEICRIVKPKVGVLTAVGNQHAALFGSMEKTIETKYELIDSLPKNGLSMFNGNNQNTAALYQKTIKNKVLYLCGTPSQKADIIGTHIMAQKTFVTFDVIFRRKKIHFKAPILGAHSVENILPGIFLAFYLGMKEDEVKDAVSSLAPPFHTMARHEIGGVSFIDDTFNANPESVLAALEYMRIYTGKKILVLQPLIELGKYTDQEHRKIGKAIGNVCDYLLLTNKNYKRSILDGVKKGRKKCTVYTGNALEIRQFLNTHTEKRDVVVFEGKETRQSLEKVF